MNNPNLPEGDNLLQPMQRPGHAAITMIDRCLRTALSLLDDRKWVPLLRYLGCTALAVWLTAIPLFADAAWAAGTPLDDWRKAVVATRKLAENETPRAYEEAQKLRHGIPAGATPADQARALNLLARTEIYMAYTEQGSRDARAALDLATKNNDNVGIAEAELNLALNSVNEANIDELVRSTTHSMTALQGINRPDLLGEAMLRTAVMYRRLGQFDESVRMCVQAMEIARRSNDPLVLIYAHQGLGISFDQSEHFKEAQQHFTQMLEQARLGGYKLQEAYALVGLGGITAKLGDTRTAETQLREANKLFRAVGSPYGIAHSLHSLASFMQSQGRYAEAEPLLDEVMEIFRQHPHKIGIWYTLISLSNNLQALNRLDAAIANAEQAYAIAREINLSPYLSESEERLARLAALKGDYKRAYELSAEAAETTSKATHEKSNMLMLELAQRYETESKKSQIEELQRRNEQQTAELRQRELRQRWLWTVLGGSLLMLAGAAYFLLRLRLSHQMLGRANRQLRRSQLELEGQTEILQSILDSMGDGVVVANEQGQLLLVNPAGENILGIGLTEGDASGWSERYGLYLPDRSTLYPSHKLPLARALRGESCDNVEMFVRNAVVPEGLWLSVTTRPLIDRHGISHGGVAVFSDITANKEAEEKIRALNAGLEQEVQQRTAELRQQTRYLRTLIDMLPMLAWFKDTQSHFLVVNRAVAEAGGETMEGMIGKSDKDFWPAQDAEAYVADDQEVMASGQGKTVEEKIVDHLGASTWIETYKAPVLDEDGTVLGTIGFARDISASKATEAAREAALEEARRLARVRSEFLAQMSHELRTPLNGILGYAQILLRSHGLDSKQISGLNVIMKSGEHLLTLINDILDFTRIEAHRMELYPSDFVLPRFLRIMTEMVSIKAAQKNLAFECDISPDLPKIIHADEKRLRQVLLNLLANAVKFTDQGKVSFRVRSLQPERLRFEVEDTGIGILPEYLDTIFQPFEQSGEARRRHGGTGLGLTISRQFVRLMGSDIHVESQFGKGSVFWFELDVPVVEAELPTLSTESAVVGYRGARKKILVVDDVTENRAVLVDMLDALGFQVLEADDGEHCLTATRQHHPDLILMDIVMPDMDGLEATRRLRAMPEFAQLPIIAVSASTSNGNAAHSLEAGMTAFIPKPVEFEDLLPQITACLKLDWIYDKQEEIVPPMAELVLPPDEEMQILHSLALQGNMRDILGRLAHFSELDARYRQFAEQLRVLAQGYQSKALLSLVEQYMGKNGS